MSRWVCWCSSVVLLAAASLSACGSSSAGAGDAPDAMAIDAGLDAAPTCTMAPCPQPPPGLSLGDPMVEMDGCAFALDDEDLWSAQAERVDALKESLPVASVEEVLGELNRTAVSVPSSALSSGASEVSGVVWAFRWNDGDNDVDYWIPQSLTGSPDASADGLVAGRKLALVSWYHEPSGAVDKGVRVSLADVTDPSSVSYRHLLLVEPFDDGQRVNLRAVPIHAGGAVWYGDYLYVADTFAGLRVFDMSAILEVATGKDVLGYDAGDGEYYAHNYRYVIPQIGRYLRVECEPRFSFVGLDRSTSPPSLVSGEYDNASPSGRAFRWPVDPDTDRLAAGRTYASEAFFMGYSHVQGAVSHDGTYFLSTSEPPSGRGDLVTTSPAGVQSIEAWVDAPEDLVYDQTTGQLWGCGEAPGKRYVFAVAKPL